MIYHPLAIRAIPSWRYRFRLHMLRPGWLAAFVIVFVFSHGAASAEAPQPLPPESLNWQGDPNAPDLSGVWQRIPSEAASAVKSAAGWQPWPPPLKGPFAVLWKKRVQQAAAGQRVDDPVRGCLPPGMPRYMTGTMGPLLIIQMPGRVTLYRDNAPVRRIWVDGRANPKTADLEYFSDGNAIGHYEGADLVTEVVGIKDEPIDATGVPHSGKLKITERFHRVDSQSLRVDLTLTDADALSRPMRASVLYKALNDPRWEPKEFICHPVSDYHPEFYVR